MNYKKEIQNNPIRTAKELLGLTLWEKEREIIEAVWQHKEVSVRSCNSSGKTYTAANIVHLWLLAYPDQSIVLTTAPTGRQVKELLWREVRKTATGKKLYPVSSLMQMSINLEPKWFALGLSTDEADKFQGFHSEHLLVIVDEASGVSEEVFEAIDGLHPTRILLIGNPMRNTGRFADTFKMPHVHKIKISAFDTPNITEGRVVIPGLVTQENIETIKLKYGEDSDVYRIRILGEFPHQESNALFSVEEVSNAINRTAKDTNFEKKMGVDVARFGDDRTVLLIRQMDKVYKPRVYSGKNTQEVAGLVLDYAKDENVLPGNINIDVIGIGAGVVDALTAQKWEVNGINVGESPEDKEHFINLRAELYHKVKDWIGGDNPKADLPNDDFLELCGIYYKYNAKGQIQIESKDEMKKRKLPSPDIADSLMLTFAGGTKFYSGASEALKDYYPSIGL